jgi:hypothetical protein
MLGGDEGILLGLVGGAIVSGCIIRMGRGFIWALLGSVGNIGRAKN